MLVSTMTLMRTVDTLVGSGVMVLRIVTAHGVIIIVFAD